MVASIDETGSRHGKLTVVGRCEASGRARWLCSCDCGGSRLAYGTELRRGDVVDCGCGTAERRSVGNTKHGMTFSPEHWAWINIRRRCHDERDPAYLDYGGRGVSVYGPWRDSFEAFFEYMGPRPAHCDSIDRYPDNDGNYEPGNVRWADMKQQNNNRRPRANVTRLTAFGHERTPAEWVAITGMNWQTVRDRIKNGWSPEDALTVASCGGGVHR